MRPSTLLGPGGDVRLAVLRKRLAGVGRTIPVVSTKGGVGKTLVSVGLALALREAGFRVGLLDLDVTNPSAHIALGEKLGRLPEEEKGVLPPVIEGIKFMSVAYYSGDNPLPLRGWEVENVVREVLAITIWGELDYLIIDTPPGLSDEVLDVLSYLEKPEPLVVATPSPLAINSVRKLLEMLRDEPGISPAGLIENMSNQPSEAIKALTEKYGIPYLGNVGIDPTIDSAVGKPELFKKTKFYEDISKIATKLYAAKVK